MTNAGKGMNPLLVRFGSDPAGMCVWISLENQIQILGSLLIDVRCID